MSEPVLVFHQVSKRYHTKVDALKGVSFAIHSGEMVFLTGHSGAGKSTILRLIAGLDSPSQGVIRLAHHDMHTLNRTERAILRQHMGIIWQDPQLLSDRSIFDNVALPLLIAGYRYQDVGKRVRAALDKVGLLPREKMYPGHLSAGEQQRLSVARAVVNKPKLIIADEPTGNLDPSLSVDLMKLFEQFQQVGVTVLVASHDLVLLSRFPHRQLVLERGRLVGAHKTEITPS